MWSLRQLVVWVFGLVRDEAATQGLYWIAGKALGFGVVLMGGIAVIASVLDQPITGRAALVLFVFGVVFVLAVHGLWRWQGWEIEPTAKPQKGSTEPPLLPVVGPLPKMRPRLAPSGYARQTHAKVGFEVSNDGKTAYDVSVPPVALGDRVIRIWGRIGSLEKHARIFCAVDIEHAGGLLLGGLFDLMQERNIDEVPLAIYYRDFDQNWYATDFKLVRNVYVSGGIEIGGVAQRRADGVPVTVPPDNGWPAEICPS